MDGMLKILGVSSKIQQEAIRVLACSRGGFMESEKFRYTLVSSLAPVRIKKVNEAIETLIEEKLLIRRVKTNKHETGLNKEIWKLSSETIGLIREATAIIAESMLIDSDFSYITHDVKMRFRKLGGARRYLDNAVFDILVARFLACEFPARWRLNADNKMAGTSSITTDIKAPINSVTPPDTEVRQPSTTTRIKESASTHEPSMENLEDWAYEQVGEELDSNKPDKGIWTKAFAQAGGNDIQTKVLYIKMRVEKLIAVEQARLAKKEH